mmetsp:Transcript_7678/g.11575  ORF Transcript_7678/g.11575 Transcript_7678/m.11575 type:complete len:363 (+) Transcript_7678:158-1246(+)|eukprot:CAMPEP_0197320568 /NCGR_PEP_ID=MMETSP0891-20130614/60757_1 /TAXON_ID=44058 ORGANISM="Aureoumbra lagunensis, Strain CCMP1510" /NCGR_SAMPLE_ID=MMETSP0891 /ASSEMBLY_ACC=CAM_ASM_000534 /LENGTH=362 /DNA_ID=CAMNT_0042812039 /DNA_START=104 /DNA_END=1192 /DNA_ORIENTATION=-
MVKTYDFALDGAVVVSKKKRKPNKVKNAAATLLDAHVEELRKAGLVYEVTVGAPDPLGMELVVTRFASDQNGKKHQRDMLLVASTSFSSPNTVYPGDEIIAVDGSYLVMLQPEDATTLTKTLENRKATLTLIKGLDRNERLKAQKRDTFHIHVNQPVPADIFELVGNSIVVRQLAPPLTAVVATGDVLEAIDHRPVDPITFCGITSPQSDLSFKRKRHHQEGGKENDEKRDLFISHVFTEESTKLGFSIAVARFAHRESSAAVIITHISPHSEIVGLVDIGDEIMAIDGVPILEFDITDSDVFNQVKKRLVETRPIEITFAKPALTDDDAFLKQQAQQSSSSPCCFFDEEKRNYILCGLNFI